MNKILDLLYLNNCFRLAIYFLKIFSFFNNHYKNKLLFFNYFKKRKKKFDKQILQILRTPRVFIIKFPNDTQNIINKIYNYEELYKKNEFSNDGHYNVYQSEHNLNKDHNFFEISRDLESFINFKLKKFIKDKKLRIYKLWFVITKDSGLIKRHSHFNSEFSGIYYLNVEKNHEDNNGLKLYNDFENLEIYRYSEKENKFNLELIEKKILLIKPSKNDLIIFNSYIEHSVENKNSKINDRITLPFDLIF